MGHGLIGSMTQEMRNDARFFLTQAEALPPEPSEDFMRWRFLQPALLDTLIFAE